MAAAKQTPARFGPAGKRLIAAITGEYELDTHERELLNQAAHCLDVQAELQRRVASSTGDLYSFAARAGLAKGRGRRIRFEGNAIQHEVARPAGVGLMRRLADVEPEPVPVAEADDGYDDDGDLPHAGLWSRPNGEYGVRCA